VKTSRTYEDCPQVTHPLGADAPEDVGVERAERLVRDPVAKSDRWRQRLLASWQLRDVGVVLEGAPDRDPAERQRSLPIAGSPRIRDDLG
jgi:hypothetical protein